MIWATPVLTPHNPVNATKATSHHSEPAIAINPTNPKNIVAGCNSPTGAVEIMVTHDGGLTWAKRILGTGTSPGGDGTLRARAQPGRRRHL